MSTVQSIYAYEVLDSRGYPTVEVSMSLSTGESVTSMVPSGASVGSKEALELRDNDTARYCGRGVLKACQNVNEILAPQLIGFNILEQHIIDACMIELDGSSKKKNLGANAILGVSISAAKLKALTSKQYLFESFVSEQDYILPVPLMNLINGGAHADNNLDIQEFMIVPYGAQSFTDAIQMGSEVFHLLKKKLKEKGYVTSVGDEGGYAPNLSSNTEALDLLCETIEYAGYSKGIGLALDCAANEMFSNKTYRADGKDLKVEKWMDKLSEYVNAYPILSIEDPLHEEDWESWSKLVSKIGGKVQIVGDDLFVSQVEYLRKGLTERAANAILIKPNQVGTVTETLEAIKVASDSNLQSIISHRSGDTEDTFIADLAVGTKASQIKTGSLCRSERVSKYNQLIRIEQILGGKACFVGEKAFI